jgi:hypothetical protein
MFSNCFTSQRAIALVGMLVVAAPGHAAGAEPSNAKLPYVGLREERGYLNIVTGLPAGRGNFSAIDDQGLSLQGFVQVTENEEEQKSVRLFRLVGRKAIAPPADAPQRPVMWVGFSATLSASTSPGHFTLRFRETSLVDGVLQDQEAVLGRTCCGYHLSVRVQGDKELPVARGRRFTDLMIEWADTYKNFERLAAACCRPGFEFVPTSLFSPILVAQVVDHDLLQPDDRQRDTLQKAVQNLDSDELAVRNAASDTLLTQGQTTLLWLDSLATESLSAEQKLRLRRVRSDIEHQIPALPFAIDDLKLRSLTAAPPVEWVSQLRASSDVKVQRWAVEKCRALSVNGSCEQHDSLGENK